MPQRILVVDDDQSIVKVLTAYLEQSGYQVLPAYDGEMALHTLRRERPDLVILDLMMPQRDGYEVTNLVRADKSLAAMPIIMLTARVDDTDKIVGLELGAVNILVMGQAGYSFRDFARVGLPLTILLAALIIFLLPVFWPL